MVAVAFAVLLAGCPKKEEAAAPDASATAASASPSSSAASAAADTSTTSAETAEAPIAPPKGAPEVVDDPNAPPSHDEHDKAATTAIQKANYKSALDKLEKEDLESEE